MKNIYPELKEHLNEVIFSSWYRTNRQKGIGIEVHDQKKVPGTEVIPMEILPSDKGRYVRDGIQPEDIIILWINDDAFVPITFERYNDMYNKVFDDNEGEDIVNKMYDALDSFIKTCMERCGFDN
jgi:hypothetical protein